MEPLGPDSAIVIVWRGRIEPPAVVTLCERAAHALRSRPAPVVVCDVGAITYPDAAALDALARLELTVRRHGRELRLRNVTSELQELIDLAGLGEVVRGSSRLVPELQRQTEQREELLRVEEETDAADGAIVEVEDL